MRSDVRFDVRRSASFWFDVRRLGAHHGPLFPPFTFCRTFWIYLYLLFGYTHVPPFTFWFPFPGSPTRSPRTHSRSLYPFPTRLHTFARTFPPHARSPHVPLCPHPHVPRLHTRIYGLLPTFTHAFYHVYPHAFPHGCPYVHTGCPTFTAHGILPLPLRLPAVQVVPIAAHEFVYRLSFIRSFIRFARTRALFALLPAFAHFLRARYTHFALYMAFAYTHLCRTAHPPTHAPHVRVCARRAHARLRTRAHFLRARFLRTLNTAPHAHAPLRARARAPAPRSLPHTPLPFARTQFLRFLYHYHHAHTAPARARAFPRTPHPRARTFLRTFYARFTLYLLPPTFLYHPHHTHTHAHFLHCTRTLPRTYHHMVRFHVLPLPFTPRIFVPAPFSHHTCTFIRSFSCPVDSPLPS